FAPFHTVTKPYTDSLLHTASHRESEYAKNFNFVQVMAKQRIDSMDVSLCFFLLVVTTVFGALELCIYMFKFVQKEKLIHTCSDCFSVKMLIYPKALTLVTGTKMDLLMTNLENIQIKKDACFQVQDPDGKKMIWVVPVNVLNLLFVNLILYIMCGFKLSYFIQATLIYCCTNDNATNYLCRGINLATNIEYLNIYFATSKTHCKTNYAKNTSCYKIYILGQDGATTFGLEGPTLVDDAMIIDSW
ncbi:Hypothetical predicted protein, partial [Olea europaea subsp. europaea]